MNTAGMNFWPYYSFWMCWSLKFKSKLACPSLYMCIFPFFHYRSKYISLWHIQKLSLVIDNIFTKKSYFDMTESGMHKFRQPMKNDWLRYQTKTFESPWFSRWLAFYLLRCAPFEVNIWVAYCSLLNKIGNIYPFLFSFLTKWGFMLWARGYFSVFILFNSFKWQFESAYRLRKV